MTPDPNDTAITDAPAAAPETVAPYTPTPVPPISDIQIAAAAAAAAPISEADALGMEIIGLKHRLDLLERRQAYLDDIFAWPPRLSKVVP